MAKGEASAQLVPVSSLLFPSGKRLRWSRLLEGEWAEWGVGSLQGKGRHPGQEMNAGSAGGNSSWLGNKEHLSVRN